ncbi:hypothetical protein ACET3Z_006454 [Daucus carota]
MVNGNQRDVLTNANVGSNINGVIMRGSNRNLENSNMESELELLLRGRHNRGAIGPERDVNMYRSGSAPPTVEGSLTAAGSLFHNQNFVPVDNNSNNTSGSSTVNGALTEEEIRSHPAYLSYYYSHENHNPRLPPPLMSKEDWRVAQRFQLGGSSFGGIGDLRKNMVDDGVGSLFSMQPGMPVKSTAEDDLMELRKTAARNNISRKNSAEFVDRGSDGVVVGPRAGMGMRRKSFADILQEGIEQPSSLSGHQSRLANRSSFGEIEDASSVSRSHSLEFFNGPTASERLHPGAAATGLPRVQHHGSQLPNSFASAVGSSLSRNRTPDTHLAGRSLSPSIASVSSRNSLVDDKIGRSSLNHSSSMTELSDVAASLSGLSLSKHDLDPLQTQLAHRFDKQCGKQSNMSNGYGQSLPQSNEVSRAEKLGLATNYVDLLKENGLATDMNAVKLGLNEQAIFPRRTSSSANLQSKLNSSRNANFENPNMHYLAENYPQPDFQGHLQTGYFTDQELKAMISNQLNAAATLSNTGMVRNLRSGNQAGFDLHSPVMDPRYIQYLQQSSEHAMHAAALCDPSRRGNASGPSFGHGDLQSLQKAYLATLVAQQKPQFDLGKNGRLNHQYYANSSFGPMTYQGNLIPNTVPSFGTKGPLLQDDRISNYTSMLQNQMGGSSGSWHSETGMNMERNFASSLLEEIKNNKSKSFELLDVVDHVVDFSKDQYGSRFIQQKLETATEEEKMKIFSEIIPHARSLITDVFGNYVIQKFFEHGTERERKELASQLIGHVLPLSLQIYGCRVIQKALEVVDVDQQTKLVAELDGSIMKCVRDQNGNHVIQKCIEYVPQDRIQFVISSFFGEVVSLSTHPYGCRVIQRVLEHCDDPKTQQIIMDEIMNSVCTLAQDQYGNYVIQHVLQHGKPHERSIIIEKLAGQIVKMSQQKFASNVVEKCLTFGGPEERQLLVNEMLGSTDENEPLQAMMKDQFGNYVVQKVLETCDDHSREIILSRIKVHLNALKRYTYGKHIVSRVEKLVTAGERHIALSSSNSSRGISS